jgi:hypothetical protein
VTAGLVAFSVELRGYEPDSPNVQHQIVEKYKYQKSRAGVEEE